MLKQGDSTITIYFTQLKILWQELENFLPISSFSYESRCTSSLIITGESYREDYCY